MANNKNHINKKNCEMAKTIAKARDWYICQRCWKSAKEWVIHWSHIICEKRDHRLACNPDNIIALCYSCHFNFRHKHPVEAYKWLDSVRPWLQDKLWEQYQRNIKSGSIPMARVLEQNERLKNKIKEIKVKNS